MVGELSNSDSTQRQSIGQPDILSRSNRSAIAIEARDIHIVFGSVKQQPLHALRGVDLDVVQGSVHLVMGPAGAGKTTLLLILAGMLTPTSGQVRLLGQDLLSMSRQARAEFRLRNVGYVFQDNNLLRSLTALENVEIAFNIRGIQGRTARYQAFELLEAVGLADKAHIPARKLSGGQKQRVGVARALAGNLPLILADEPTSALDSQNGRVISELLHQRAKTAGSTVLVATHDARLIPFADRITYLEDGQVVHTED